MSAATGFLPNAANNTAMVVSVNPIAISGDAIAMTVERSARRSSTKACLAEVDPPVTRGLDPRVHLLRTRMDCRVKPRIKSGDGNDVGGMSTRRVLAA